MEGGVSLSSLYHYKAIRRSNYDGDSMRCDVDLGMKSWLLDQQIRFYGIDTPEIRGKSPIEKTMAEAARWLVEKRLDESPEIILATQKDETGKYGRLLARVYVLDHSFGYACLNDILIDVRLAQPYFGVGDRVPWPQWYQDNKMTIDPFLD